MRTTANLKRKTTYHAVVVLSVSKCNDVSACPSLVWFLRGSEVFFDDDVVVVMVECEA